MATNYKAFDLSSLPKRTSSRVDVDAAKALLATVASDGGASDFVPYESAAEARNAGLRSARLLSHVAPKGQRASIVTFGLDKAGNATNIDPVKYGFAVRLVAIKPKNNSAAK